MKRAIICFFVIALVAVIMAGCTNSLNNEVPDDLKSKVQKSTHQTILVHADYPVYNSTEEIANAATNIYVGTVKDISFEVIDMKTGKADNSSESLSTSRMLYTVYTISVTDSIKGDNPEEIKICTLGGIAGYNEENQFNKLRSSGLLTKYNGIPITKSKCSLAVGNKYLFCTSRTVGDYDFVINLTQFAHRIDSDNATAIIRASK